MMRLGDLNEGKPWSDLFDLKDGLARGMLVAEIADLLCRSEKEVREKIFELKVAQAAVRK
jgi:hypothetical protein